MTRRSTSSRQFILDSSSSVASTSASPSVASASASSSVDSTSASSSVTSSDTSSSVDSTSASSSVTSSDTSSSSSSTTGRSSDSISSPKWTPWKRLSASASTSPLPLISKETSRRSPFSTLGTCHTICSPPSPSSEVILTSSRFPFAPFMDQSLISNCAGRTSLIYRSLNAVSPLFSNRIKTS